MIHADASSDDTQSGQTVHSGHYVARTRVARGRWLHHDDDVPARPCSSPHDAMPPSFAPYLLFYERADE